MSNSSQQDIPQRWWSRINASERAAVAWALTWFFCILLSYGVLRPLRETMGSSGGASMLQRLMLITFVAMLVAVPVYAFLVAHLPRRWLVRVIYHGFAVCLVVFFLLMNCASLAVSNWTAGCLFIWINVFALFATSIFWSVLADLFTSDQGKRLFGIIAAGGTIGAVCGSLVSTYLATRLSTEGLLWIPILTIEIGLMCAWRLEKSAVTLAPRVKHDLGTPIGAEPVPEGGLLTGVTHVARSPYLALICLFLVCGQGFGTSLYFLQAEIVGTAIPAKDERTQFFGMIDFGTQICTLVIQLSISATVLKRLGVSVALAILPAANFMSFSLLSVAPSLITMFIAMVMTRSVAYGMTVPAREVLFTVVSREDKYKSKSFIDTVVLRGGDALSGQFLGLLRHLHVTQTIVCLAALPLVLLWGGVAWVLGKRQRQLADKRAGASTNGL